MDSVARIENNAAARCVARGQKLSHFRGQIELPGSLSRGATVV